MGVPTQGFTPLAANSNLMGSLHCIPYMKGPLLPCMGEQGEVPN